MNKHVDFETAKLLKEKGFDCITKNYYTPNSGKLVNGLYNVIAPIRIKAPTIAEVVYWLYEKHGIWISVDVINSTFKYKILKKEGIVSSTFGNEIRCSSFDYNSPTEAYQEAIKYTLKNLI